MLNKEYTHVIFVFFICLFIYFNFFYFFSQYSRCLFSRKEKQGHVLWCRQCCLFQLYYCCKFVNLIKMSTGLYKKKLAWFEFCIMLHECSILYNETARKQLLVFLLYLVKKSFFQNLASKNWKELFCQSTNCIFYIVYMDQ